MKKRTAIIGALVSLLPIGQPLVIGTGVVLTSSALLLSVPRRVNAESEQFYIQRAIRKADSKDWYGGISDLTKAIEINPNSATAYEGRGLMKGVIGDEVGACLDVKKASLLGSKSANQTFNEKC